MIRVLVCGGRKFAEPDRVWQVLNELHANPHISEIIHGGATGADAHAAEWAYLRGVKQTPFPVTPEEWRRIGKKAGPLRNQAMVDTRPDLVVAFPGGRGTTDCVRRAVHAGIPVRFA